MKSDIFIVQTARLSAMKKEISSQSTVGWKYIFPAVWITFMGLGVIITAYQAAKTLGWILFLLGWIAASAYIIWFARRLKFVSIDDNCVYASQFRHEIQIPLGHVEGVKENFWARPKLITLTLNHPSEFGTQVVFVPTRLVFAGLRSHPIVEEIETAIKHHRSAVSSGV